MEVEHFKPSKKYDYVPPKLCTLVDGDLTIESDRGNVPYPLVSSKMVGHRDFPGSHVWLDSINGDQHPKYRMEQSIIRTTQTMMVAKMILAQVPNEELLLSTLMSALSKYSTETCKHHMNAAEEKSVVVFFLLRYQASKGAEESTKNAIENCGDLTLDECWISSIGVTPPKPCGAPIMAPKTWRDLRNESWASKPSIHQEWSQQKCRELPSSNLTQLFEITIYIYISLFYS